MDFQKITYRSSVGDMDIPAYLFQPLVKRGPRGHAAMIWVHGGVHGSWGATMFPFVKEAVERGYVVIAPDYRGSTGYGKDHHNAIDYGGYELDDVLTAVDVLKRLPHVDPDRFGLMGWSHGGFITAHLLFRDRHPFKVGAAIVPVTNLIFRLSYKGPGYQRGFSTQKRIGGLPFEKREIYVERSPLYHVDKLQVPLLVHVATNDDDVNFVEAEQMINALRAKKPDLSETKVYVDPPSGHGFSRRVNRQTLRARGHAGAARFVEPHVGVPRVESAALSGSIEAGDCDARVEPGQGPAGQRAKGGKAALFYALPRSAHGRQPCRRASTPRPLALAPLTLPLGRTVLPRPRHHRLSHLHPEVLASEYVEAIVHAGEDSRHRRLDRLSPVVVGGVRKEIGEHFADGRRERRVSRWIARERGRRENCPDGTGRPRLGRRSQ